jgi:DNA-binding SARP family transcriptional activator/TolB-like protein
MSAAMAAHLYLRLFGPFEGRLDDAPLAALPKKTQALLAYLALEGPQQRTTLATLLWGDTGDDQAAQSLRKALSGLRQALKSSADAILVVQERTIALSPGAVSADVFDFERLVADGRADQREHAADLYRGHLVLGLDVDEAPFNEWLLSRRERFREVVLQLLMAQLDRQTASREIDAAIETAARILTVEPLHESAHRALINLFGQQGRRAAAARQYQTCADLLWRELGVRPQPATEATYRESLATSPVSAATVDVVPASPSPIPFAGVADPSPAPASSTTIRPARRRRLLIASALVIATAGAAAVLIVVAARPSPPPVRRSIAILPMKNLSGAPDQDWLSTALTETIGAELMADGSMRLVSADSLQQMQQVLSPPAGIGLTRKQLDAIGRDLGCELILTGNYLMVGSTLRVDVQVDNVATGEVVGAVSATDQQANLLALVDRAGDDLRDRLQLGPARSSTRDAVHAAFPSPAAMRDYFAGLDALRLRDGPRAADLLQKATGADPRFALAHAALSNTWKLLGYDGRAADEAKLARDASGRLSPEDRLNVEGRYDEASFNWPAAIDVYGRLWKRYHDNIEYGLSLANVLQIDNRLKEAQAVVEGMRRLPPPDADDPRIDLMESTIADRGGDSKRALEYSTRAADKALAGHATLMLARARLKQGIDHNRLGELDAALEPMAESRALFESLSDRGGVADATRWEGAVLAFHNRLDEADGKFATALEMAKAEQYVRLTTEIMIQQETVALKRNKLREASAIGDRALATAREAGDPNALGRAVATLAPIAKNVGDYDKARALYLEWKVLNRRLGVPLTGLDNNLATIDLLQGRLDQAAAEFQALVSADPKGRDAPRLAVYLGNLATVRTYQGDLSAAERLTMDSCTLYETLKTAPALAACRVRLALLWVDQGRVAQARAAAAAIDYAALKTRSPPWWDLARFATLLVAVGDRARAAATLADADRLAAESEFIPDQMVQVTLAHARLDAAMGRSTQAAARFAQAQRDADRFGLVTEAAEVRRDAAHLAAHRPH